MKKKLSIAKYIYTIILGIIYIYILYSNIIKEEFFITKDFVFIFVQAILIEFMVIKSIKRDTLIPVDSIYLASILLMKNLSQVFILVSLSNLIRKIIQLKLNRQDFSDLFEKIISIQLSYFIINNFTNIPYLEKNEVSIQIFFISIFIIYMSINSLLKNIEKIFRENFYLSSVIKINLKTITLYSLILSSISTLYYFLYIKNAYYTILLLLPVWVVYKSTRDYINLLNSSKMTLETLTKIIESKIPYMKDHTEKVSKLVDLIAKELKLPENEILDIINSSKIYTLGKVNIRDEILEKIKPLLPEEKIIVKKYPQITEKIISNLNVYMNEKKIIRHIFERYDGTGYPDNLKGDNIPIGSRIIAAADAFIALISERTYRKAFSTKEALNILKEEKGKSFDPKVIDIIENLINSGKIDYG